MQLVCNDKQKIFRFSGQPVRSQKDKLTQFHMDIAASVQAVTEEIILN